MLTHLTKFRNFKNLLFGLNRTIAIVAFLSLLLGLLNLSYIPLRDIYLRYFPSLVAQYDPVKGIEPHPQTQLYLATVDRLQEQIGTTGLTSPDAEKILQDLRQQSLELIEEDPFLVSGKLGSFAKIKRKIVDRTHASSAKQALIAFWSLDYLGDRNLNSELTFFDRQIRPTLYANYYRETDDNGQYIDNYWQIDLGFILFFGVDFIVRTFVLSRRIQKISWLDAMLRRWYDLFLLIPVWRWLRVIPVTIRLHRAQLIDLEYIIAQVTHEPAAYLSDRVSEFVAIRLLSQAQTSIEQGEVARALFQPQNQIRLNDVNEIEEITDRLLKLTIYQVLPQVQPELQSVLNYSLNSAFKESAFYDLLRQIPGVENLPQDGIESLSNYLSQTVCDVLADSYADEEGKQRFDRLASEFQKKLKQEIQEKETIEELQQLLTDLLEEVKLNYVRKSEKIDPEATLSEVDRLHQKVER